MVKETTESSEVDKLQEFIDGIRFLKGHDKDIDQLQSVLIVDDVYSKGTVVRAVIHHLRSAGLSGAAAITVACPLRIHHDEVAEAFGKMMREVRE